MADEIDVDSLFPLYQCWRGPLAMCAAVLRRMVRTRDLPGVDLLRLARLINGIENLPLASQVGLIEASLERSHASGRGWQSISLSDDRLELAYGESFHERQGTETSMQCVLKATVGEGTNRDDDDPIAVMNDLQTWASNWRCMAEDAASTFEISDEDVFPENTDRGWEALPDGF